MKQTRRFRCQPEAVTAARRYVRGALSERSRQVVEAAELLTSELATNCVRHAHTDFEITIDDGEGLRIEVRDSGPGEPRPRRPAPRELAGRGLLIVEAMADAWGVIDEAAGKTVWFSLDHRAGAGRAAPGRARGEEAAAARDAGKRQESGSQASPRARRRGRLLA